MITNHNNRDAFNEADIRFHEAVLNAVHNPVLQQLGVVINSLQRAVFARTYMPDEGNMPRTLREHQNLYDAIRHQDSEAAEQAAVDHDRQLNTMVEGYNMSNNSYVAIDWGSTKPARLALSAR